MTIGYDKRLEFRNCIIIRLSIELPCPPQPRQFDNDQVAFIIITVGKDGGGVRGVGWGAQAIGNSLVTPTGCSVLLFCYHFME